MSDRVLDQGLAGRKIGVSHFGVSCLDFSKMLDFYTRVVGLTIADEGHINAGGGTDLAFLTTDPNEHHQFVLASNRRDTVIETTPVEGGSIGSNVFQVSFRVRDLDSLRRLNRRLTEENLCGQMAMDHGNAWSLYVRDPEGNGLEFFVDTPWYVAQPCAEPFDLEEPDETIMARTEAYIRSQPEGEPVSEWSAALAKRILQEQARL
ncbi:VOC family protein [Modestobacter sp. VKM Ac-2978]|uniref:VOC family protein n=1 Tax=Modestobacter sp. VKM Ac-2978 TaxID=3004132 RepID=UPI0022AAF15A|nr:VOC family protein [Modestobacter sp. VKM Ac-2978]MCZ2849862.1 VOC family protein [Modestobacter sp. VKM Ac-2978]